MNEINPRLSASRSLSRSFNTTRLLLKKQLWIWPLVAALILMLLGFGVQRAVDRSLRANIAVQLETVLKADVAALDEWMKAHQSYVHIAASDPRIAVVARELIALAHEPGTTPAALAAAPQRETLQKALAPWFESYSFRGYVLCDTGGRIVAAKNDELIGKGPLPGYDNFIKRVLAGETLISKPFPSIAVISDANGRLRSSVPTMFAASPLRDEQGKVIGALGLRIPPEVDFTRILNVANMGTTGETYAFDRNGVLLSESRFDDELKSIGLLPDKEDAQSILNVELRDPQVDMSLGQRPTERRSKMPLTRLVTAATAGETGVDVDGYRDYRGSPSYGAWTWLDKYDFGMGTEVDIWEAARPGQILRWAFWGLYALLAIASLAIFGFTLLVARLQQQARRDALSMKRLGQYTLEEKIGAGGMGVVYRGHHAMLRRATAIKLLDVEKTTDEGIKRFEREVSLTSQLNHPNTISIYDYGRTPEGIFYYAMELLDGMDLEKLVRADGPQPEGRVIHILLQICGSLSEAHQRGLIHRDIKPANIFLTQRGGVPDFAKLLDFGLVKAVDGAKETQVTQANAITGTPLYMPPESIQRPDEVTARSDLYALGAVGYFLVTGTPPFRGQSIVELCTQALTQKPEPPSQRLGKPVSAEFEAVLLACLEKDAGDRPASATELATRLRACAAAHPWTDADAAAWWSRMAQASINATIAQSGLPTSDHATDHTAIWTSTQK